MALTKIDDRGLKTPIDLLDNEKIQFGTGNDLKIYHNGTDNYIMPSNGKLIINNGSETLAQFISDGACELYHNNGKKLQTDSAGTTIVGHLHLNSDDNHYIKMGAGNDLQIYHDGTYNWIDAVNNHGTVLRAGTGILYLQGSEIHMGDEGGNEVHIKTIDNGAVELYHDNVKTFNTVANGVQIRGPEGGNCELFMYADEGDDNSDLWKFVAFHTPEGTLDLYNKTSGSWEKNISCIGDGAVELYHDNVKVVETMSHGAYLYGPEGGTCNLYMYADEGDDNADKWRLRNESGSFYIQNYNDGAWESAISCQNSNQVRLFYDNSEKLNTSSGGISITGKIYMNNGNLEFGTSGNGVDFSATSDATGKDNELFDDYEEGTFTPSVAAVSAGWDSRTGTYTKVGDLVTVFIHLNTASGGSTNGDQVAITGLPFTSVNNNGVAGVVVGYHNGLINDNYHFPFLLVSANTTTIYFHKGDGNSFTGNDVATSDFSLHVSCTYKAA